MENFGGTNLTGNNKDFDDPIPLDDELDKPIRLGDDDAGRASVSHSPLSLGGGNMAEVGKPVVRKAAGVITSGDRITGVKTFFTKLHPGAMEFLDEQINKWLKDNPGVAIKRTDSTTGEVQAKKTEPNIIITVWY
jgi:hypothetical protein